jgi:hypothetical protein
VNATDNITPTACSLNYIQIETNGVPIDTNVTMSISGSYCYYNLTKLCGYWGDKCYSPIWIKVNFSVAGTSNSTEQRVFYPLSCDIKSTAISNWSMTRDLVGCAGKAIASVPLLNIGYSLNGNNHSINGTLIAPSYMGVVDMFNWVNITNVTILNGIDWGYNRVTVNYPQISNSIYWTHDSGQSWDDTSGAGAQGTVCSYDRPCMKNVIMHGGLATPQVGEFVIRDSTVYGYTLPSNLAVLLWDGSGNLRVYDSVIYGNVKVINYLTFSNNTLFGIGAGQTGGEKQTCLVSDAPAGYLNVSNSEFFNCSTGISSAYYTDGNYFNSTDTAINTLLSGGTIVNNIISSDTIQFLRSSGVTAGTTIFSSSNNTQEGWSEPIAIRSYHTTGYQNCSEIYNSNPAQIYIVSTGDACLHIPVENVTTKTITLIGNATISNASMEYFFDTGFIVNPMMKNSNISQYANLSSSQSITFLNVTVPVINNIGDNSQYYRNWYLHLSVVDDDGNLLDSVNYEINNTFSNEIESGIMDQTKLKDLQQYYDDKGAITTYEPYLISASKAGYFSNSTSFNFSSDAYIILQLSRTSQYSSLSQNISNLTAYNPIYVYNFNSTWTANNVMDTVLFEWEGVNYTATNVTSVYSYTIGTLTAGSYTYAWCGNDTLNNWNCTQDYTYTVNKADILVINVFNPVSPINYGTSHIPSCQVNNTISVTFHRNSSVITNNTAVILAAGSYNYSCMFLGNENYSASSDMNDVYQISQNTTNPVLLYLNGTKANMSMLDTESVNATGYMVYSGSGSVTLFRNGDSIVNPYIVNLPAGLYKFTANTSGNANYSSNVTGMQFWLEVNASDIFYNVTLMSPANATLTNDSTPNFQFRFNATYATASCQLFVNDIGRGVNVLVINNTATTITANSTIPDGTNLPWYINCTNSTTVQSDATRYISIDTVKPALVIYLPQNVTYNQTFTINISYNVTDINLQSIWYEIKSVDETTEIANTTVTANTTFTLTHGGHFYLRLWANDSADNRNSTVVYFSIFDYVTSKIVEDGIVNVDSYELVNVTLGSITDNGYINVTTVSNNTGIYELFNRTSSVANGTIINSLITFYAYESQAPYYIKYYGVAATELNTSDQTCQTGYDKYEQYCTYFHGTPEFWSYSYDMFLKINDDFVSSFPVEYRLPADRFIDWLYKQRYSVTIDSDATGIILEDGSPILLTVSRPLSSGTKAVHISYSFGAGAVPSGGSGNAPLIKPVILFSTDIPAQGLLFTMRPGDSRLEQFKIENIVNFDLNLSVWVEAQQSGQWVTFVSGGNRFTSINSILPEKSPLDPGYAFITYNIAVPQGFKMGTYDFVLYIKGDDYVEAYPIRVTVTSPEVLTITGFFTAPDWPRFAKPLGAIEGVPIWTWMIAGSLTGVALARGRRRR